MKVQIVLLSIFKNHLYAISFCDRGHYCGYVKLEDNEKSIFDKAVSEYKEICDVSFISCHGGVTFVSHENGDWILPEGNWIGFDCAHSRDGKDFLMVEKVFGKESAKLARDMYYDDGKDIKITPKMVSAECKDIIEQIVKMKNAQNS